MENLVPISLFLVLGVIIVLPAYFWYLSRVKELETLSKLAQSSEEIRADILKYMKRPTTARSDLRRGLVLLALAIPIIVAGLIDGTPMVSIIFGGVPLLVGLAYVYMAKSAKPTERDLPN